MRHAEDVSAPRVRGGLPRHVVLRTTASNELQNATLGVTMDRAQIRHVAELAELELTEDEETRLVEEIGRIVSYVAELDAIDTTGIPPTAHVMTDATTMREDVPAPGLSHEDALAAAPRALHGGFSVPTFVE